MNGQAVTKAFIPLPAGATAVYTSGPTLSYFRHPDWLGSSRFASTATTRQMYSDLAYAPFGETYAEAGTPDRSFTGQNQDTAPGPTAGLYDFLFREYAQYGRWISPDPAGMAAVDPSNPKSWNRYAYVLNAPLNGVDFLGLDCFILGPGPLYPVWTVPCGSVPGDDPLPPNPFDDGVLHEDLNPPGWINLAECIDVHGPRGCAGAVKPANNPPVGDLGAASYQRYLSQRFLGDLKGMVVNSVCKGSSDQRILTSMRNGFVLGATRGAIAGATGGAFFEGVGAIPGAILGGTIGGIAGAGGGVIKGGALAGACSLAGVY